MRQDEGSLMDIRVVVTTELIFLLLGEATERFSEVDASILGAHDVTNLTTGVSGDTGVSVFNLRVKVLTEILDLSDKRKMEPHTFTLGREDTLFGKSVLQELEEIRTEERLGGTIGIRGIGDNNIVLVNLILQELETVTDMDLDLGVLETNSHVGEILLGDTRNGLININKSGFFNTLVLDDFTEDTTITTTDDKDLYTVLVLSVQYPSLYGLSYLLGTRVRVHGKMGDHLLVTTRTHRSN